MCECELENDYLTLCDEHKQELENLKNNPPLWAKVGDAATAPALNTVAVS